MLFCPFFTEKYAERYESEDEHNYLIQNDYSSPYDAYKSVAKLFWYIGLLFVSISVNSIIINLVRQ